MPSHPVPFHRLLDRHVGAAANRDFLQFADGLLTEAVNRSTWIFARCWESAPATLFGQVPLFLFRHVLEMADAVHILMVASATAAARPQLRSLFEGRLFLQFMVQQDTDFRVKCYAVNSYYWSLRWARRLGENSPERAQFQAELFAGGALKLLDEIARAPAHAEQTERYLQGDLLGDVYRLFLEKKKALRHWPAWHEVAVPSLRSTKDLAQHLGASNSYLAYELWSRSVHPDLLTVHVLGQPDGARLVRKIRDGELTGPTIHALLNEIRLASRAALQHTRTEELVAFDRDWETDITQKAATIGEDETHFA